MIDLLKLRIQSEMIINLNHRISRPMDVHILNTNTLRWSLVPMRKDQKYPQVPFQRYGKF
jgi:hypothetical protein